MTDVVTPLPPPPLTEPLIVPCLFCSGTEFEIHEGFVRIVGWVELPAIGDIPERRVISRLVLPADAAHNLSASMLSQFRRSGN